MSPYQSKRAPRAHQAQALEAMQDRASFALFMAMRTGKTKTVTDDFGRLCAEGKVDDLLVIAPAGVYKTWPEAMALDLDPRLEGVLRPLLWSATTSKNSRSVDALAEFIQRPTPKTPPRALFVNVEALSTVERAQRLVVEYVHQRRCYVVVDESTVIKDITSKRTQFLINRVAPHATYRRILSGLPTPQSPLDVYGQFAFLQPGRPLGFSSFYAFRARYAVTRRQQIGARSFEQIIGFRLQEDLAARVHEHAFRVRLEDCYDLPESTYEIRHVELTTEQTRIYRALRDEAQAALSATERVTADLVITQLLRLHQVLCGVAVDERGVQHAIPENRTRELLALLDEYGDGKVVIWAAYDASVRRIVEALERVYGVGSVARFWGGNAASREDEERRFKADPRCRFMVATAAAGGRGRTWDMADLTVYHSNTHNLEHRSQSEERVKAVDKASKALYVDLVSPGTVDEKILHSLRQKINLASALTGDAWKAWVV